MKRALTGPIAPSWATPLKPYCWRCTGQQLCKLPLVTSWLLLANVLTGSACFGNGRTIIVRCEFGNEITMFAVSQASIEAALAKLDIALQWIMVGEQKYVNLLNRFLPVVAAVLTLQCVSGLLEAVLLHSEAKSGTATLLVALARNGPKTLSGLDIFVRELSEVALIIFM